MGAVVSAIGNAIGGIVEGVGDAVEDVGQALGDVGKAIDDYVIQPILDDPLTAVATVAGAAILGPMIAPAMGAFGAGAAAVGAGLGAAAGNTTAGLVQGEDFDEAIKGGIIAGVTAGVTKGAFDYFGDGSSAFSGSTETGLPTLAGEGAVADSVGTSLLSEAVPDINIPGGAYTPSGAGLDMGASFDLPTLDPSAGVSSGASAADPLGDFISQLPGMADDVVVPPAPVAGPSPLSQLSLEGPSADYGFGIKPPAAGQGGFGIQQPSSPSIASMGGGQGLTSNVAGLPEFTYGMDSLDPAIRGMSDSWFGDGLNVYGNATPSGTVGEFGFTQAPQALPPALPGTAPLPKTLTDKLKSFEFSDINADDMKGLAGKAVDYAMDNPLTTLAGITLATGILSQDPPQNAQPQQGSTRDPSFDRPMDLYNYLRSQQNYGDDIYQYGQRGGEHQFFTPSKFELIPKAAAMGGLIQMKQGYQAGGRAAPMNPRMMQQGMPPGGMGRGMPMRGGLNQAMQTGNMPPAGGGMPQGRPQGMPQGMPQGRPQPVNRNPRTSYYQYGTPPKGMEAGGALNMVRSYNVGGGADGRSDDVDAVLSDGEYVFDAETVALLGNGSSEAGANRLEQMREQIRRQKGRNLAQGKISDDAKSPLSYLKGA
jgi:hypothetical protein